ncbi:titin, partial [Nephila pilipes]
SGKLSLTVKVNQFCKLRRNLMCLLRK